MPKFRIGMLRGRGLLLALLLLGATSCEAGADDGAHSDMPTAGQSPMGMVMAGRALGDGNVTAQAIESGVIGTWKAGVKGAAKAAMDEVREDAITDDPFRRSGSPTRRPRLGACC